MFGFRRRLFPLLTRSSQPDARAVLSFPFAELAQEFVGRHVERVLLEDAADDHRRVHAHRVHDDGGAELGHVVGAADRIVVLAEHVVDPGLVLDEVVDPGPVEQRPLRAGHESGQGIPLLLPFEQLPLEQRDLPVLVEVPVLQVGILPVADDQPFLGLGPGRINARVLQAPHVVLAPVAVDDVERAITLLEPLLDVGQEHPVLFLLAVEEGTDVPGAAEDRTGQPDLLGVTHRVTPCCQHTPEPARWREENRLARPPTDLGGPGRHRDLKLRTLPSIP